MVEVFTAVLNYLDLRLCLLLQSFLVYDLPSDLQPVHNLVDVLSVQDWLAVLLCVL